MRLPRPLQPGSTIGILGGGQLGRMLVLAASRLGMKCHIYAPPGDNPAFDVAAGHTIATFDDMTALKAFAKACDVITYEFENVPGDTAQILEDSVALAPQAKALQISQDRALEKDFIKGLGVEVAPFAVIDTLDDLKAAVTSIGVPSVLKTRRFGYDGKGQVKLTDAGACAAAWDAINGAPAVLEGFIHFHKEVSVIAARGWDGEVASYELTENVHENHILRTSTVPARVPEGLAREAREIAEKIVTALGYVGVMGVEMFVGSGKLLVNEVAPRVHNSGHWTMDACLVSQFEQHIRAICGWPLGDTFRHSDVVMRNLLGHEAERWKHHAGEQGAAVHLYGKTEARPGRKMGHINTLTPRQG
jgi:5-(carboxyamino)imidazole ribonucleotide synthase